MFRRAVPILASLDLDATVGFYESRLGFESVLVTDAHAIVERDGVRIHFWLTDDPEIPKVTACRIDVAGIQTLYEEMT
ncbi:MAG TPA: hypothetical protein VJM33_19415, partial [Microthrixaceae bacterium]|nr:hypothetical protein [Microthrixaceae bacterium]